MTGNNKFVLSVYSEIVRCEYSKVYSTFVFMHDVLQEQDKFRLMDIGVPCGDMQTKQEAMDYVLITVKEFVPILQKRRKYIKAVRDFKRVIKKKLQINI